MCQDKTAQAKKFHSGLEAADEQHRRFITQLAHHRPNRLPRSPGRLSTWLKQEASTPLQRQYGPDDGIRLRSSQRHHAKAYMDDVGRLCLDWRLNTRWAVPLVVAYHLRRVRSGLDRFIGLVGAVVWVPEASAQVTLGDGPETITGYLSVAVDKPRPADLGTSEIEAGLKRPLRKRERRSVHRQIDSVRLRLRGLALNSGKGQVLRAGRSQAVRSVDGFPSTRPQLELREAGSRVAISMSYHRVVATGAGLLKQELVSTCCQSTAAWELARLPGRQGGLRYLQFGQLLFQQWCRTACSCFGPSGGKRQNLESRRGSASTLCLRPSLLGEAPTVLSDLLDLIKSEDEEHYGAW